jgi:hypothetical protein
VLDVGKMAPFLLTFLRKRCCQLLVEGVKELVLGIESEIMRLDGLLCGPVFEQGGQGVALGEGEVTFLGGSGKVSGILSCLGSRGAYLMSAGTMSLGGSAAL